MKKITIAQAAEYFGVSKEAIHNRIRRGSLQSVVENGIKMVQVDTTKKRVSKQSTQLKSVSQDRYYRLLEEQNAKLQARIDLLENETRSLRDQKEQMLIEERKKIEQIYKEKDEQLKNILATISAKFLQAPATSEIISEDDDSTYEVELEEAGLLVEEQEEEATKKIISLKKFIKKAKLSDKEAKKFTKKIKKRAKKDERITIVGDKYYLDITNYDYSDLL